MDIPYETQIESLKATQSEVNTRKQDILEILKKRKLTAHEIVEELLKSGKIKYYCINSISARLSELKDAKKIEALSKRYCELTNRNISVWSIVDDKKEEDTTISPLILIAW